MTVLPPEALHTKPLYSGEVPEAGAGGRGGGEYGWRNKPHNSSICTVTAQAQARGDISVILFYFTSLCYLNMDVLCCLVLLLSLQVRKDDVQTVVPISKSWSLMNTAIMTGRQV